jgi:hypothetical protein
MSGIREYVYRVEDAFKRFNGRLVDRRFVNDEEFDIVFSRQFASGVEHP